MNCELDRYLRRTGMSKSALGRAALSDGAKVARIMSGHATLTLYSERRLRRFMAEHPDGIAPGKQGRPPER